jgi:hypothetical protein
MNIQQKIEKDDRDYEAQENLIFSLRELREIQKDLGSILTYQNEKIETIEDNLTSTNFKVEKGYEELVEAKRLKFSLGNVLLGTFVGAIVGGPIGMLTGAKYAIGVGGAVGGVGSYFVR